MQCNFYRAIFFRFFSPYFSPPFFLLPRFELLWIISSGVCSRRFGIEKCVYLLRSFSRKPRENCLFQPSIGVERPRKSWRYDPAPENLPLVCLLRPASNHVSREIFYFIFVFFLSRRGFFAFLFVCGNIAGMGLSLWEIFFFFYKTGTLFYNFTFISNKHCINRCIQVSASNFKKSLSIHF